MRNIFKGYFALLALIILAGCGGGGSDDGAGRSVTGNEDLDSYVNGFLGNWQSICGAIPTDPAGSNGVTYPLQITYSISASQTVGTLRIYGANETNCNGQVIASTISVATHSFHTLSRSDENLEVVEVDINFNPETIEIPNEGTFEFAPWFVPFDIFYHNEPNLYTGTLVDETTGETAENRPTSVDFDYELTRLN